MKYPFNPNLRGGNYTATRTEAQMDKTGTLYMTTMGDAGNGFGTNLWRIPPNQPAQLIMNFPGDHGSLHVLNKRLIFVRNGGNRSQTFMVVEGYVHPGDELSNTVVNINEAQLASVRQQLQTAMAAASAADSKANTAMQQVNALRAEINTLKNRITKLEAGGTGNAIVDEGKIADIVWAKLWDAIYILRMAMNAGVSKDPNAQGWIHDLEKFIKRVN